MAAKPYVGITGPVTEGEVAGIVHEFTMSGYTLNSPHLPMLGYLVSFNTLNGREGNRRYPKVNNLHRLLAHANHRVFTTVHYNSREPDLADQVARIFNMEGIYQTNLCRAMQLNIVWPEVLEVGKIKDRYPDMSIIFQLSHKAAQGKTKKEIVEGIKQYGDTLAYVLIDPSGGRGLEFDVEDSIEVFQELREHLPFLSIGFAGGFTGENVGDRVRELIERTGTDGFSIDAEGGLRDKAMINGKLSDRYGDDFLNLIKVRRYLEAAAYVLP